MPTKRQSAFFRAVNEAQQGTEPPRLNLPTKPPGASETEAPGGEANSPPPISGSPDYQQDSKPVSQQNSIPAKQHTVLPVSQQDSMMVSQYTSKPARQYDGKPVSQQDSMLVKATFYLSEDDIMQLERIRLARRSRGVRVDKSALIREAIKLLQP